MGAVSSRLMRSRLHRAVRVRALAGDIVLCSWARHFTLTVPLSTQVYKWVPALHATETGTSSDLMGLLIKSYSKGVCTVSCTYYGPNFETSALAFDVKALKNTAG